LFPRDWRTVLAVEVGVQFPARPELIAGGVPGFVGLAHAARSVAANQHAKTVVGLDRIVPALGFDRHRGTSPGGHDGLHPDQNWSSRKISCQAARSRAGATSRGPSTNRRASKS